MRARAFHAQNAIRHNLSLHHCFTRLTEHSDSDKGCYWTLTAGVPVKKRNKRRIARHKRPAAQLEPSRTRATAAAATAAKDGRPAPLPMPSANGSEAAQADWGAPAHSVPSPLLQAQMPAIRASVAALEPKCAATVAATFGWPQLAGDRHIAPAAIQPVGMMHFGGGDDGAHVSWLQTSATPARAASDWWSLAIN